MSTPNRVAIDLLPGFQSPEVASFLAQLDDQTASLDRALREITPDELSWQPRPGMNTIGMLLAHLAIVEVWWSAIATGQAESDLSGILGIGPDDDGMPLAVGGPPPAGLAAKDRAYFDQLLARARRFVKETWESLPESAIEREVQRTRADGTQRSFTMRWILYHIVEHFAGHFGQIRLQRHLYQIERAPAEAAGGAKGA
jgi:uncharacterized damage-inducible protein DinB